MAYSTTRSVRFQEDLTATKQKPGNSMYPKKQTIKPNRSRPYTTSSKMFPYKPCKTPKEGVLSRIFSEDYDSLLDVKKNIFDPHGPRKHRWNRIFLVACLVSLFLDPLFFYLPATSKMQCIELKTSLEAVFTVLRSLADVFYFVQIFVKFRTAFVAPSSRVFGRGELVIETSEIASRYLKRSFWLDLLAALPLPQFLIWVVVPNLKEATVTNIKNLIRFGIVFQYIPRLFLIFPLTRQIVMTTGVMTETAWAGAAYNLVLYMLASHVCSTDLQISFYQFGIYTEALNVDLTSSPFLEKYFYCFWWGLKNLSCLGQNLTTSTSVGEIIFAIVIAVLGLVLFGLLIGNMQSYLQSTIVRLEEWRIRRRDMEQWMHHRKLPPELMQCVRRYHQYRWVATQGVNEESLLKDLPIDLRRDIKRHICLDLVQKVPLFDEMDDRMLEAICERLKPALFTKGTCIIRELDPVDSMLFIIRGYLDSCTTQGGRTGFFNSCRMSPGEFCGEELLTWALNPQTAALPLSTRTVRAVSDVEAFALVSDDLKFVASQFRRLHSKQLRHKFRYYSNQWRTWAACFIQATWRQLKRRRASIELRYLEGGSVDRQKPHDPDTKGKTVTDVFSGKLMTHRRNSSRPTAHLAKSLKKPTEPDFTIQEESE